MSSPSTVPPRKLSARRSSSTASDPYATNRGSSSLASSVLTIVKVAENEATAPQSRRSVAQRNNQPVDQNPGRVSFAFASFGGRGRGGPARPPPKRSHSPKANPSPPPSPTRGSPSRTSSSFATKPNLSPDELYHLARQSVDPFPTGAPQVSSPVATTRPLSRSPSRTHAKTDSQSSASSNPGVSSPAFTPLAEGVFLPFIDRPKEVTQLITTLPTLKLFVLLDKTLPKESEESDVPESRYMGDPIPKDPRRWTYDHLYKHLTSATRENCPDTLWIAQARMCIMAHSEILWERVKGALGVPVELDSPMSVEQLFIEVERMESLALEKQSEEKASDHERPGLHKKGRSNSAISDMNTDEISDDEGMKAKGHWNDWDFILDSPVYDRRASFGSAGLPASSSQLAGLAALDSPSKSFQSQEELFKAHMDNKLNHVQNDTDPINNALRLHYQPDGDETHGTVTGSPTPPVSSSPPRIITQLASPVDKGRGSSSSLNVSLSPLTVPRRISSTSSPGGFFTSPSVGSPESLHSTTHYTASTPLNISAILKSSSNTDLSSPGIHPPPLSLPPSLSASSEVGLGDIAEGEEEEESSSTAKKGVPEAHNEPSAPSEPDPSTIQGLRLSVGASPIPSYSSPSLQSLQSTGLESDIEGDYFDPVGEREPGNPLFPGSFARLALAPTLSANNPSLRSPTMPPPPRYKSHSFFDAHRRAGHWGRLNKQFSEAGSDYAVSVASSSRGAARTDEKGEGSSI